MRKRYHREGLAMEDREEVRKAVLQGTSWCVGVVYVFVKGGREGDEGERGWTKDGPAIETERESGGGEEMEIQAQNDEQTKVTEDR